MKKKIKILITGASSGIGKAIAKNLLEEGHLVIGLSRTCSIKHKNYIHYTEDISNIPKLISCLDKIIKDHKNISVVVSNAGAGKFEFLDNLSEKQITEFINLNLLSHIILTKKVLPLFKKKKKGYIIFMGSEASTEGSKKATLYSSAKHGLMGFAKSLKAECNKAGIRVSIINPGMVRGKFFDSLDFAPGEDRENAIQNKDIADLVSFLIKTNKNINYFDINLSPLKKVIKFKKKN